MPFGLDRALNVRKTFLKKIFPTPFLKLLSAEEET
jgi:hypothetical protein